LLGGSGWDVTRHVLLPSALSWVFTSLRTAVGFALVGAVVGEYMGSDKGLGNLIQYAQNMFDSAGVFAGVAILSITVIIVNRLLELVELRCAIWRPQKD
jgi:NitT/TauT family transport system permease protein